MIKTNPFKEKRPVKNTDKKLIYVLNSKKQPEKIISNDATMSDFEYECKKQKCFALALVSVKNIAGKNKFKLIRINYN